MVLLMKKILEFLALFLLWFIPAAANVEEGKIHLECKVINSADIVGPPIDFEEAYLYVINIEDGEYEKTGTNKKSYVKIMENYIFEYSFSNKGAEIRTHTRDVGTMEVATAKNFSEALYQKTKQKLDRVNANIKNYQPEIQDKYEIYNISKLGNIDQENEKYSIIMKTLNYLRLYEDIKKNGYNDTEEKNFQVNARNYKCNKTDGFK